MSCSVEAMPPPSTITLTTTGVSSEDVSSAASVASDEAATNFISPPSPPSTSSAATAAASKAPTAETPLSASPSTAAPVIPETSATPSTSSMLSPFDLSGIGMGFGIYRPRRPSYTYATQQCVRQRSASYRHATRQDAVDYASEIYDDGDDFIDGVLRTKTRKPSYLKATSRGDRRLVSDPDGHEPDIAEHLTEESVPGDGVDDHEDDTRADDIFCDTTMTSNDDSDRADVTVSTDDVEEVTVTLTLNNHTPGIATTTFDFNDETVKKLNQTFMNHTCPNIPPVPSPRKKSVATPTGSHGTRTLNGHHSTPPSVDLNHRGSRTSTLLRLQRSSSVQTMVSMFTFNKNLIIMCLSFILVFSSFQAIQNLQSSINPEDHLGVLSMMVVHIAMIISCLISPIIINIFTAKWALCIGILCFMIWFGANFNPTFYTLVPTAIFVGLGKGILWSAENSYILKLSFDSARARRKPIDQEMFRFHGIFLACFQTTHIWGNLISSLILSGRADDFVNMAPSGSFPVYDTVDSGADYGMESGAEYGSMNPNPHHGNLSAVDSGHYGQADVSGAVEGSVDYQAYADVPLLPISDCGALHRCGHVIMFMFPNFVPHESQIVRPVLWKLMTSYIVLAVLSFALIIFALDRIGARAAPDKSPKQIILGQLSHLVKHKTFRLLLPLLFFNGLQQGFMYSDYNEFFVTCKLGVHYVGYVMITLGVSNVLGAVFVTVLAHRIPREVVLGFGGILHISLMIGYLIWIPESRPVLFFVMAAAWGMCDAVWQTQCNTMICLTCAEEPEVAFTNLRLMQSMGLAVMFGAGTWLCVSGKLYLLMSLLVVAIMFYVLAEYTMRHVEEDDVFVDY